MSNKDDSFDASLLYFLNLTPDKSSINESNFVKLPMDKNGKCIKIDSYVLWCDTQWKVNSMTYYGKNDWSLNLLSCSDYRVEQVTAHSVELKD